MSDRELHVHIRRLTIDEAAMSSSPSDLRAELEAGLSQRLGSGIVTPPSAPVAQIVDAVATRTNAELPRAGGTRARP